MPLEDTSNLNLDRSPIKNSKDELELKSDKK